MISKLPDHILQLILSHIPSTEEVIRTSILSRRWRHLWTLIPSIDIDFTQRVDSSMELTRNGLKEFVYWVLLNKPLNLDSFRLRCFDDFNISTIRRWIHAAVVRKVKSLDLMFCPEEDDDSEDFELPHCLVTCSSLEVLRLNLVGARLCSSIITGFSALRVLELNDVELTRSEVLKYILESCPLLEDLSLLHCEADDLLLSSPKLKNLSIENLERVWDDETKEYLNYRMSQYIQISCPNLVFLNLTGPLAFDFLFEDLYSLKKAVIHIKDFFKRLDPAFDVFDELSNVESLSISLYCVAKCYWPRVHEHISLPNLKTLELTVDGPLSTDILIPFLNSLPDLESLHLIFIKYFYGLDKLHRNNLDLEDSATISILTRHLKKVDFLDFDEEKPKIDVARALLEHGNELEEMVFSWGDEAKFHERSMETLNEMSKFHKASSTVKIRGVINPSQGNSRPDYYRLYSS